MEYTCKIVYTPDIQEQLQVAVNRKVCIEPKWFDLQHIKEMIYKNIAFNRTMSSDSIFEIVRSINQKYSTMMDSVDRVILIHDQMPVVCCVNKQIDKGFSILINTEKKTKIHWPGMIVAGIFVAVVVSNLFSKSRDYSFSKAQIDDRIDQIY